VRVSVLANVQLVFSDGAIATLGPGDVIGRMPTAAVVLDDPRVSECHAMVSLRGAELQLLSLRGMFAVNGRPSNKVVLAEGQVLSFADGIDLTVRSVLLPNVLTAVQGEGLPAQVLSASSSLFTGPPPRLVPGTSLEACAWLWSMGADWRLRVAGGATQDLHPGDVFEIQGRQFSLTEVQVERAGVDATVAQGGVGGALVMTAGWDTFRIERAGVPPVLLGGVSARLLSVLAEVETSLSWEGLASEIWPSEDNRDSLRRRLDVSLSRLRSRLRETGIRTDLVQASGSGHIELLRYADDVLHLRN
jgi:hypothetical protein